MLYQLTLVKQMTMDRMENMELLNTSSKLGFFALVILNQFKPVELIRMVPYTSLSEKAEHTSENILTTIKVCMNLLEHTAAV